MSETRYIVLMGTRGGSYSPTIFLDGSDGRNDRGLYFGNHVTSFRSLDIAKRRVRWSRERDKATGDERWGYIIRRVKPEEQP